MGYDMYVVDPDPTVKAAADEVYNRMNVEVDKRVALDQAGNREAAAEQQKVVDQLYDEWVRADKSYYRLNIFGMSLMRQVMEHYEMLQPSLDERVWPEPEHFGLVQDDDFEAMRDEGAPATPEFTRWQDAVDAFLRATGEGSGIPEHKFGSNDGWIVTPDECREAVAAYERTKDAKGFPFYLFDDNDRAGAEQYVTRWVDWLRYAATRGGFQVW